MQQRLFICKIRVFLCNLCLCHTSIMPQNLEYSFEYMMTGDSLSFFGSCFFFSQKNLERREVFGENAELNKSCS